MRKWRQYLLGRRFTILTDHRSLKELLTQVIQTPEQHLYMARLMGYDYDIQYRSGSTNHVVDALSRLPEEQSTLTMILSSPCFSLLKELRTQLDAHHDYGKFRQAILADPTKHSSFSVTQDFVLHKGRIWVPRDLPMITTLLQEYHATPTGGHAGVTKTMARLSENFTWLGLRDDVTHFIANCLDCQLT